MDSHDIFLITKLLEFFVGDCKNRQCDDCYKKCGECPMYMLNELSSRNNIQLEREKPKYE